MTPADDNYADGRVLQEYESRTCCVRIRGESCRAVDGSNAPKWPKSMFANSWKCFFLCGHSRGVMGTIAPPD